MVVEETVSRPTLRKRREGWGTQREGWAPSAMGAPIGPIGSHGLVILITESVWYAR